MELMDFIIIKSGPTKRKISEGKFSYRDPRRPNLSGRKTRNLAQKLLRRRKMKIFLRISDECHLLMLIIVYQSNNNHEELGRGMYRGESQGC